MDYENIRALIALILVLAISLWMVIFDRKGKEEEIDEEDKRRKRIRSMAFDAVIIALLIAMSFIPYVGFINVGPFSLTLLHLPVLLGASLFGWKRGLIYGTVFGLLSWAKALSGATSVFDIAFQKIYVAVPPRMLFGLIIGVLSSVTMKIRDEKKRNVFLIVSCFVSTCLHTVLVFGDLFLAESWVFGWVFSDSVAIEGTGITILGFLAIGMVLEASLGAIITPILNKTLKRAIPTLKTAESASM
ncbi:MAG: ECF transporter S component [Bacilli bacterium]|nr:ECF transporter S component [Bacilli bacterium]